MGMDLVRIAEGNWRLFSKRSSRDALRDQRKRKTPTWKLGASKWEAETWKWRRKKKTIYDSLRPKIGNFMMKWNEQWAQLIRWNETVALASLTMEMDVKRMGPWKSLTLRYSIFFCFLLFFFLEWAPLPTHSSFFSPRWLNRAHIASFQSKMTGAGVNVNVWSGGRDGVTIG